MSGNEKKRERERREEERGGGESVRIVEMNVDPIAMQSVFGCVYECKAMVCQRLIATSMIIEECKIESKSSIIFVLLGLSRVF